MLFSCAITVVKPFNICDKITPEFPLAPLSAPFATALASGSNSFVVTILSSLTAERIVKDIFVPVSPSGTGNTLSEST